MTVLRDLLLAEEEADAARRALAAIPEPFRTPGDAEAAMAKTMQAHAALQAALHQPEPEPEAGL